MANITAQMVKELRESTGAGMMDCKKALVECDGDAKKAAEYLQVKGLAKAAKRGGRKTAEGYVGVYRHHDGKGHRPEEGSEGSACETRHAGAGLAYLFRLIFLHCRQYGKEKR